MFHQIKQVWIPREERQIVHINKEGLTMFSFAVIIYELGFHVFF